MKEADPTWLDTLQAALAALPPEEQDLVAGGNALAIMELRGYTRQRASQVRKQRQQRIRQNLIDTCPDYRALAEVLEQYIAWVPATPAETWVLRLAGYQAETLYGYTWFLDCALRELKKINWRGDSPLSEACTQIRLQSPVLSWAEIECLLRHSPQLEIYSGPDGQQWIRPRSNLAKAPKVPKASSRKKPQKPKRQNLVTLITTAFETAQSALSQPELYQAILTMRQPLSRHWMGATLRQNPALFRRVAYDQYALSTWVEQGRYSEYNATEEQQKLLDAVQKCLADGQWQTVPQIQTALEALGIHRSPQALSGMLGRISGLETRRQNYNREYRRGTASHETPK